MMPTNYSFDPAFSHKGTAHDTSFVSDIDVTGGAKIEETSQVIETGPLSQKDIILEKLKNGKPVTRPEMDLLTKYPDGTKVHVGAVEYVVKHGTFYNPNRAKWKVFQKERHKLNSRKK